MFIEIFSKFIKPFIENFSKLLEIFKRKFSQNFRKESSHKIFGKTQNFIVFGNFYLRNILL